MRTQTCANFWYVDGKRTPTAATVLQVRSVLASPGVAPDVRDLWGRTAQGGPAADWRRLFNGQVPSAWGSSDETRTSCRGGIATYPHTFAAA